MSSRLLTSRIHAPRFLAQAPRAMSRCAASAGSAGSARATRPAPIERGQRRAQVVRDRGRAANCAGAPTPSAPWRPAPPRRSARARARWRAGRRRCRAAGAAPARAAGAGSRGCSAEHAAHAHRRLQRQVQRGAGRQRVGAVAGGLGRGRTPIARSPRSMAGRAPAGPASCSRSSASAHAARARLGRGTRRARKRCADLGHLLGEQRAGQVARQLVQRARARPRGACATRAWIAQPAQSAGRSPGPTTSITAKVTQVLHVARPRT